MNPLTRQDLMSLEQYAEQRETFRAKALAHKRIRTVAFGPNMTFLFEDRTTVQYQVQEMLRIERIFEAAGIQDELDAYNPLIPDGLNLKATMLVEFPDPEIRKVELAKLTGIEHEIFFEVEGLCRATTVADEDMSRSSTDKTSAVHFYRFQFSAQQVEALRAGKSWVLRCADARYPFTKPIRDELREALMADFD